MQGIDFGFLDELKCRVRDQQPNKFMTIAVTMLGSDDLRSQQRLDFRYCQTIMRRAKKFRASMHVSMLRSNSLDMYMHC